MKRYLSVILAALLMIFSIPAGAFALGEILEGDCGENVTWRVDLNTETLIISGSGDTRDVKYSPPQGEDLYPLKFTPWARYYEYIKHVYIGNNITSIGNYFFHGLDNLESVTVPASVKKIGEGAFYQCYSLKEIVIPEGVEYIGDSAFLDCVRAESLNIPSTVTYVGINAVPASLTSLTVSSGNPVYHSDNNCLIQTSEKILIAGCKASKTPKSGTVKTIARNAFYNGLITSFVIPEGCERIEWDAFYKASYLEEVLIPPSVTSIGSNAFGETLLYKNPALGKIGLCISAPALSKAIKTATKPLPSNPAQRLSPTAHLAAAMQPKLSSYRMG